MSLLCHLICGLHRTNTNENIPTVVMDLTEQETFCMDPKVIFASFLSLIKNDMDEGDITLAVPYSTLKVTHCL